VCEVHGVCFSYLASSSFVASKRYSQSILFSHKKKALCACMCACMLNELPLLSLFSPPLRVCLPVGVRHAWEASWAVVSGVVVVGGGCWQVACADAHDWSEEAVVVAVAVVVVVVVVAVVAVVVAVVVVVVVAIVDVHVTGDELVEGVVDEVVGVGGEEVVVVVGVGVVVVDDAVVDDAVVVVVGGVVVEVVVDDAQESMLMLKK